MSSFTEQRANLWRGTLDPQPGELSALWQRFGAQVIVGHPTFRNVDTIGRQLAEGIAGAKESFGGRRVSFVVSDGTCTSESSDTSTIDAALDGASRALDDLDEQHRSLVQVVATPYEGYGENRVPGKGSALKMVFDEMEHCQAELLILLDGDLRNDMAAWQGVFARVEQQHRRDRAGQPMFVTVRYARHFVDASLTRFIVGPLTTLMGRYVPGGISGDIALSASAVAHERQSTWTAERLKYGTDIATTFDNIADPQTAIYELYFGAKLHDITDEGKLSVMPGEVIGAALERLAHWESIDGRVTRRLEDPASALDEIVVWGPERTGISFIDPGATDVFDVDAKISGLVNRFDSFAPDIERVEGSEFYRDLSAQQDKLKALQRDGSKELAFLGLDADRWIEALHRAVAFTLAGGELDAAKRCLNYLYTAAFLEFVKDRLAELGHHTVDDVRRAQAELGVPADRAEAFYRDRVDKPVRDLALEFFARRARIVELMAAIR
jgi:hypothetical protein